MSGPLRARVLIVKEAHCPSDRICLEALTMVSTWVVDVFRCLIPSSILVKSTFRVSVKMVR